MASAISEIRCGEEKLEGVENQGWVFKEFLCQGTVWFGRLIGIQFQISSKYDSELYLGVF